MAEQDTPPPTITAMKIPLIKKGEQSSPSAPPAPKTAKQLATKRNRERVKSILLLAIPDEYLLKFRNVLDAKSLREVIKSRFGGNDESKKMQTNVLKHQFENFTTAPNESLDKAYDRFQKLISQMEVYAAPVSKEDINQKFLRSLPPSWSQIALIMRNKPDIDQTDIHDLYNNLRVYEDEIKRSSSSTSNSQNLDFLSSENTSRTNEIDADDLEELDLRWQVAMLTIRVKKLFQKTGRNLDFKERQPVSFDKSKIECYNCHRKGHFARECNSGRNQGKRPYGDNSRRNVPITESSSQALVAQDGLGGYDWSNDFDEPVNYALMAISSSSLSSSSETKVQNCSKQCLESFKTLQKNFDSERKKHNRARLEIQGYELALESLESRILGHEKNELAWGEKYEFQNYELKCREIKINNLQMELEKVVKERGELKLKTEKWEESSKNLSQLLNSQMSARDKTGLGYWKRISDKRTKNEAKNDKTESTSLFLLLKFVLSCLLDIGNHLCSALLLGIMYFRVNSVSIIVSPASSLVSTGRRGPTITPVPDEATTTRVGVDTEGATTTTTGLDAGLDSGNIHESPLRSYETPLHEGHTSGSVKDSLKLQELMVLVPKLESKVDSLEKELKETKQTLGSAILTLVKKVKSLEVALKRKTKRVVVSDLEDEETEAQRRKIQELDDDPLVSLVKDFVTPTKTNSASREAQEEDISPTTLEAAKTLSKVASQKARSIDKGRRYKRRKVSKGKDAEAEVNTDNIRINTGSEDFSTGSLGVSTGTGLVSTLSIVQTTKVTIPSLIKSQREGKAPMTTEEIQATKRTKAQIQQEEAAKRISKEEELSEQQKKRKAEVQEDAQHYTEEDWDTIRAKLEANAKLTKSLQGESMTGEDFAKRMLKTEFEKLVKSIENLVPIEADERVKRQGVQLEQDFSKKQKIEDVPEETVEEPMKKIGKRKKQIARKGIHIDKSAHDDAEEENEAFMKDKVTGASSESKEEINVIPTTIKPPSIIDNEKVWQNRPKEMYDRVLWGDLKTMFDPPLIHCLTLDASSIYMLADRKYPLSKDACQVMLKMKLLDGTKDEVKSLEVALKRKTKRVVVSDLEDEETEAQGRKIQELDDDPLVSLVKDFVTPTKTKSASREAQEEDISPTTLEAAKTLSKVASQKASQRNGKAPMTTEEIQVLKRTKDNSKEEAWISKEEELSEQQKKRKAEVQEDAQHYTKEDWDTIKAKLEANAELTKSLQGESMTGEDFAKRMLEQEYSKKQKIVVEDVPEEKVEEPVKKRGKRKKQIARKGIHIDKTAQEEVEEEKEAFMKDKVTGASLESEEGIDAILTAIKPPSIVDWKIIPQSGLKCVYQIIRIDGSDKIYMSCIDCIYMLADRKYPLSKDACQVMLKMKLLDGTKDEVCYQLLKMIEKQEGIR
ncbi:ribonuclease H-like domain-containing protein [Tanacetum coccineum]|uniref:Ribonuclease H-like domain-containing protein n=1 Tax=Tanacetum coccineum TaxID=301880 RepID=A0ABQ4ZBC3_9ASTR